MPPSATQTGTQGGRPLEVYEVVYHTLLMIVLINLLIAMMSTTYSGLKRRGRKKHSQIQCVASLVFHAYLGIPSEIPRVRKCFTAFVSLGVITRVRKCFGHSYLNLWVFSGRTRRVEARVHSRFVRGYTGRENILIGAPALAAPQKTLPLATGTLRSTTHLAMGTAKRGVFWMVLGHFGPRAANLAENTGNTANCLF